MVKVGLRMKDDVEVKEEGLRSGVVQEGGGGNKGVNTKRI